MVCELKYMTGVSIFISEINTEVFNQVEHINNINTWQNLNGMFSYKFLQLNIHLLKWCYIYIYKYNCGLLTFRL